MNSAGQICQIVKKKNSFTCLVWNKVRGSACFHGDTVKTTKSNVTRDQDHKCVHSNSHHCTEPVFPHQNGGLPQYREERPLSYRITLASVTLLQYCLTLPTLPRLTVRQYCSLAHKWTSPELTAYTPPQVAQSATSLW